MSIAIVTDSTAQLPAELAARLGVWVVPITITIDGVDHEEGVDLDADGFYERYVEGETVVTTSAPSPGRIVATYEQAVAEGATGIVSIHVGADHSATGDAAAIAARLVDVPVEIVDTGLASFGVALAVWAAVDARRDGGGIDACASAARRILPSIGSVFVLDAGVLPRRSGRFAALDLGAGADGAPTGVPVYFYGDGVFAEVGVAVDEIDAARLMAERIVASRPSRIASGLAGSDTADVTAALERAFSDLDADVVTYRVGPSVAAHTGPRTAGAFFVAGPLSPDPD